MSYFTNLPIRYIEEDRSYLEFFLHYKMRPELGLDAISVDECEESVHREISQELKNASIPCSIHLPFHDMQPGSIDRLILNSTRERLKKAICIAQIYEPEYILGHTNFFPLYINFFPLWLSRAVQTWEEMLKEWPEHPPLYLENVREADPRPLNDLLSELKECNVKFCFDVGHWASYGSGLQYNNLSHWIQTMGPFLQHLHIHDNDGIEDLHLGLGQGIIPWVELFSGLELLELSPSFTLEPHAKEDLEISWTFMKKRSSWFTRLGVEKGDIPEF